VAGRHVVLVDDGLATGYTALAAAAMLRRAGAAALALAVPVSPVDSLERVEEHFDAVRCLRAQTAGPFAVASFYRDFHEMTDEEVLALLREANPPAAG
jgi:predicted phosphoribosyltransferase